MIYKKIGIVWRGPGSHSVRDAVHPKGAYEFFAPGPGLLYWFDTIEQAKEYIDYLEAVGILYP